MLETSTYILSQWLDLRITLRNPSCTHSILSYCSDLLLAAAGGFPPPLRPIVVLTKDWYCSSTYSIPYARDVNMAARSNRLFSTSLLLRLQICRKQYSTFVPRT